MHTAFKKLILAALCGTLLPLAPALGQVYEYTEIDLETGQRTTKTIDLGALALVGATPNNPVVFEKVKTEHALNVHIQDYIRKHHEDHRIAGNGLSVNKNGRIILDLMLKSQHEDKTVFVYFDVDDVYRKYKKLRDKELAKQIKEVLEREERDKNKKINPYHISKERLEQMIKEKKQEMEKEKRQQTNP